MNTRQKLLDRVREILPWSISIKLMLSALLGVLGGAGLLGYLSEYATYNYAIHYGFRPPLEGIPYLRPAVAFGSLFLLMSGAFVFALIAFALRSIVWYFDILPRIAALPLRLLGANAVRRKWKVGQILTSIRSKPLWHILAQSTVLPTAALSVFIAVDFLSPNSELILLRNSGLYIFLAFYFFAISLAVLHPSTIWWTAIIVTAAYFFACVYFLFSPTRYSEFLRLLGYGGGISVRVESRDIAIKVDPEIQQLMLRTTEAVILYDSSKKTFIEIPRDQIRRMVHDSGGMRRLPYVLPEKTYRWGDR